MTWVRLVGGRLIYSGRLPQPKSFDSWAGAEGKPLVDALASRRRFAFFGRHRAARRELWTTVRHSAERGALGEGIAAAVDTYLPTMAEIATLPVELPRAALALRRIVVVPRVVCNATALEYVSFAVERANLVSIEGSDLLSEYVSMELLTAMDEAVLSEATRAQRPVLTSGNWVIVGAERQFSWWVPLAGDATRDWRGHYVLYEAPPGKLTRAARKDLSQCVSALQEGLPRLSRQQRNEIVTHAHSKMRDLTSRALRRSIDTTAHRG